MSGTRLGDLMVKDNLINPTQLTQALEYQKKNGGRLGSCLVKLGFVSDENVTTFLSRQYGVPCINLSYFEVDPEVVRLVPEHTARRYEIVPLAGGDGFLRWHAAAFRKPPRDVGQRCAPPKRTPLFQAVEKSSR